MAIHKLTKAECESGKPGKLFDGGGLRLEIGRSSKSWVQRYMIRGKSHDMGLGSYDDITLDQARDKSAAIRKQVHRKPEDGGPIDPLVERRAAAAQQRTLSAKSMTFRECAETYIKAHRDGWRSPPPRSLSPHRGQCIGGRADEPRCNQPCNQTSIRPNFSSEA